MHYFQEYGFLQAGKWKKSTTTIDIINPYNSKPIGKVHLAGRKDILQAISSAEKSFEKTKKLSSFERSQILKFIADALQKEKQDFAKTITLESGKPIKDSITEVDRAISTFTLASEEVKRFNGEYLTVDVTQAAKGKRAIWTRVPAGPVSAITPFNFPLNLVAHKIAPAIAVGAPIILKPASKTPLTALRLGEIILKSGWPADALSILPCKSYDADPLVTDERIKVLSFTGGAELGWSLKAKAGKKKVILELGGNAAAIVCEDADLQRAVERCKIGGYYYSGQNCIHVQRIYVHASIYKEFEKKYISEVQKIKIGDPTSTETDLGPIIDDENVKRLEEWIKEAKSKGAKIVHGGQVLKGPKIIGPTIMTNVPNDCNLRKEEAFGPVVILEKYSHFDGALKEVNNSRFGLQAGVFTNNMDRIFKSFNELNVGGVIINDVPTFRVDNMPYGGVKDSGFGREGVRFAMEEMTEIKLMVMHVEE